MTIEKLEILEGERGFKLEASHFEVANCDLKERQGGRRYASLAFTEHGVLMLSSVLNSERAIQANIQIMPLLRLNGRANKNEDPAFDFLL